MKKILAFLLAAVMLFAVAGCSQDGSDSKTPPAARPAAAPCPPLPRTT